MRDWQVVVAALGALLVVGAPVVGDDGGGVVKVTERESRPLGRPAEVRGAPGGETGTAEGGGSVLDHPLVRTGGSLAVVLGLIFGLAKVAQRVNARGGALAGAMGSAPSPSGLLEVLGRFPLGRGQMLVLLRVDTRVLLLSQSTPGIRLRGGGGSGTVTTLCEMTSPEDVASILVKVQDAEQASAAARFGELLGRHEAMHDEAGVSGVVEVGGGSGGGGAGGMLRERLRTMRAGGGR